MDAALLVVAALAQMLVLITRNIDLSIAAVIGLSAYMAASMVQAYPGLDIGVGLATACAVGGVAGLLNGLVVTRGRIPAIVVTLASMSIFRGFNSIWAAGDQISADEVTQAWLDMTGPKIAGVPLIVVIAIVILGAGYVLLYRTAIGRELFAIGSNPDGARLIGIPVDRRILVAFGMAGLLGGLCGALWASRYATIDARVALGFELTVIASAVVGGVAIRGGSGTLLGIVLGALTLLVIRNGLTLVRVDPLWLQGVYGLVILVAIGIDAFIVRRAEQRETGEGEMRKFLRSIDFWDLLLAASCLAIFLYAAIFVPNFVSGFNLSQLAASASEKALLILPMALLIIAREIDLSIASMLALTSPSSSACSSRPACRRWRQSR